MLERCQEWHIHLSLPLALWHTALATTETVSSVGVAPFPRLPVWSWTSADRGWWGSWPRVAPEKRHLKANPAETERDRLGVKGCAVTHPFSAQPQVLELQNAHALDVLGRTSNPITLSVTGWAWSTAKFLGLRHVLTTDFYNRFLGLLCRHPPIHLVFQGITLTSSSTC